MRTRRVNKCLETSNWKNKRLREVGSEIRSALNSRIVTFARVAHPLQADSRTLGSDREFPNEHRDTS